MKSINNHIYWTAAGSTSEPERIAKWAAILNHVRDVHTHEDPLYPKCEHVIRKTTDKSKWLQAGSLNVKTANRQLQLFSHFQILTRDHRCNIVYFIVFKYDIFLLAADTLAFNKLEKLLSNKRTLKDVSKLSPHHQTSSLEAFHAVILRFAPKNVVFPLIGMLCR